MRHPFAVAVLSIGALLAVDQLIYENYPWPAALLLVGASLGMWIWVLEGDES